MPPAPTANPPYLPSDTSIATRWMQIAPNSLYVGFLRSPNAPDRIHINGVWGTADLENGIYVVEPETLGGGQEWEKEAEGMRPTGAKPLLL